MWCCRADDCVRERRIESSIWIEHILIIHTRWGTLGVLCASFLIVLLCVKDDIPQFIKLIICMFHRVVRIQFHTCYELENLTHDCMLIFRESDFKIFHTLIIHENHHAWENSRQFANWIPAAFFQLPFSIKSPY